MWTSNKIYHNQKKEHQQKEILEKKTPNGQGCNLPEHLYSQCGRKKANFSLQNLICFISFKLVFVSNVAVNDCTRMRS